MSSPAEHRALEEAHDFPKRLSTIAAELALKGFSLHPLAHGGYLIARWDRNAYAPDLRGAAQFLERLG